MRPGLSVANCDTDKGQTHGQRTDTRRALNDDKTLAATLGLAFNGMAILVHLSTRVGDNLQT